MFGLADLTETFFCMLRPSVHILSTERMILLMKPYNADKHVHIRHVVGSALHMLTQYVALHVIGKSKGNF